MSDKVIFPYQRTYVELESVKPVYEETHKPFNTLTKSNPNSSSTFGSFLLLMNKTTFLIHLISFLLGRAGILQGLTPFGIGFFTAISQRDRKYGPLAITTFLGIVTVKGIAGSIPYGFTMGIIYILFQYVLNLRKTKIFKASLIGATVYLLTAGIFLSFKTFYLYDWIMIAFESIVIFVVVYISSYAIPVALQNMNRKILSTEEIICISIITALVLSGINEIYILGLSLRNILGILMTILFAYNGGASIGASVGITLGLITSMSTNSTPVIIGIFGFSGLLAGIFKDIGKLGSALGFLMGNAILTFYINGYYEIFIQFKEVIAAFCLFVIIPKGLVVQLEKFCNTRTSILNSSKTHSDRTRKLTYEKLKECATTFGELSATFEKISVKQEFFENEDLSKLIEKVANNVCLSCGMKRSCWDQNFNTTYQGMLDMLIHIEENSSINYDDLPQNMKKRCIRPKAVMERIVHLYELSYLNMMWKQRLIESREMVGKQLKDISNIIENLSHNVKENVEFDVELEDSIYVALDKAGLWVNDIMVLGGENRNLEIFIEGKKGHNINSYKDKLISLVSETADIRLVEKPLTYTDIESDHSQSLTLVEANKYSAYTKTAVATKDGNNLSGDSYTFMELKNGQYMTALSDGMGTGDKAHLQSSATIDMLEKMMEAGFNREIAIKTINSMLMLKSSEEMFSSLDMTIVDLHRGKADFIKIGSAPSFIKRKNGDIEEITSSTLPIGILREIQIEGNIQKLEDGDIIITLSDGIIDSNKDKGEKWIVDYLKNTSSLNPQEIADGILHTALNFTENVATDDLTVLVTKVWEIK